MRAVPVSGAILCPSPDQANRLHANPLAGLRAEDPLAHVLNIVILDVILRGSIGSPSWIR